eukprot:1770177-Rhodomonas_salina.1
MLVGGSRQAVLLTVAVQLRPLVVADADAVARLFRAARRTHPAFHTPPDHASEAGKHAEVVSPGNVPHRSLHREGSEDCARQISAGEMHLDVPQTVPDHPIRRSIPIHVQLCRHAPLTKTPHRCEGRGQRVSFVL